MFKYFPDKFEQISQCPNVPMSCNWIGIIKSFYLDFFPLITLISPI